MDSVVLGFVKQAGIGAAIGRQLMKPKVLGGAALFAGGAATGVGVANALHTKRPMAPGALHREKRRAQIDRFGTM